MTAATAPTDRPTGANAGTEAMVDPRAPRFGQTLTALGLGGAVVFDTPILLYAVAVVLVAAVASGWRLDLYAAVWRTLVVRALGSPTEREAAAPHRFARVLGAIGATLASVLVVAGFVTPGYAVAAAVAGLAALAASTGLCVGCRMYRQVALFRRLHIV